MDLPQKVLHALRLQASGSRRPCVSLEGNPYVVLHT